MRRFDIAAFIWGMAWGAALEAFILIALLTH